MKYRLIVRASPSAEVKQQIAQINQNLPGEILLQGFLQAIYKPDINPLTFEGEIERFDPATTFQTHNEMPLSVALWIIMRDMPGIFETNPSSKDIATFRRKLEKFARTADQIQSLWAVKSTKTTRAVFDKHFPEYNKCLNYLQQHLRTDLECSPDIAAKRDAIRDMAFYETAYRFRSKKTFQQLPVHVPEPEPEASSETRFTNYDGMPILTSHFHRIRVPQTQDPMTHVNGGGAAFGFDSHEEAFNMFCAALDSATPDQLKRESMHRANDKNITMGSLSTEEGRFYIELLCRHNLLDAMLPSNSPKIVACLTKMSLKHTRLSQILGTPSELRCHANLHALGLYLEFHKKVQKKIKQLLSASFGRNGFDLVCIDCYRPGCDHFSVLRKPAVGASSRARCTKCRIAEFCLKCTRASHGGECDRLDEASEQLIRENTRVCPRCLAHVEKNGGCNHMSCRCGAHFCWLCNQSYERNQINDHYVGGNAYGGCRGILNPIAPHGVAVALAAVAAAAEGGAVGGGGFIPFDDLPPMMVRANAEPAINVGPPPMLVRAHAVIGGRNDRLIARAIRAMHNDGPQLDRPEAEALLAFLLDEAPVGLPLDQRETLIGMMLAIVQLIE